MRYIIITLAAIATFVGLTACVSQPTQAPPPGCHWEYEDEGYWEADCD
ncbi:membrane protein [Mycobacterium phage Nanosmite]|nr:membrane protein [Mycobacterium phage Nanosmite]